MTGDVFDSDVILNDSLQASRHEPSESAAAIPGDVEITDSVALPESEVPNPASSSSGDRGVRVMGPRVNSTPFDVFDLLVPSKNFKLLVDENAHRFTVETRGLDGHAFPAPYNTRKRYKNFGERYPWEEALKECHQWMWFKWLLVSDISPFEIERQSPGVISRETLELFRPKIESLKPATNNHFKRLFASVQLCVANAATSSFGQTEKNGWLSRCHSL